MTKPLNEKSEEVDKLCKKHLRSFIKKAKGRKSRGTFKKMKKAILTILVFLFVTSDAAAIVFGGSNLGIFGYPEFNGFRPSRPYSQDSYSRQNYRREMENYLDEINGYLENARNDILRIREAMEAAQSEADDAIDEFNRFARGF